MKNNLWAKVFFGFFACISLASASYEDELKSHILMELKRAATKGHSGTFRDAKFDLTKRGQMLIEAVKGQDVPSSVWSSVEQHLTDNKLYKDIGVMNAVLQAKQIAEQKEAEQRKKPEQDQYHPEDRDRIEREEATRKEAERRNQEQTNIQFETPRPASASTKDDIGKLIIRELQGQNHRVPAFDGDNITQAGTNVLIGLGLLVNGEYGLTIKSLAYRYTDNGGRQLDEALNKVKEMEQKYGTYDSMAFQEIIPLLEKAVEFKNHLNGLKPQENPQDIQPQENPQDIQPQDIQPQDIQPQVRKIKGKLFGDLIKNKNHKHLFSNGAGFTEVPTQLLYDMLKKLGFNSDAVKANSKDDLIKNLINLYDLSGIEGTLKDLNNAGYTGQDDGGEAVHGVQNFLQDTVKTYKEISDKEPNPLQIRGKLTAETQDDSTPKGSNDPQDSITPQGSNDPQDSITPQGEDLQVKTASDAAELRKKLLKKLNTKEKREWNKIMKNTAKEERVKEKSVLEAYSVLMNPKSQDSTIAKISDEAINVLIKSQVLFSLSNPVKVNLRTVVKKTPAAEEETQKLFDRLEEKIDVVKNGVDYGAEIDENTIYAMMSSMFSLKETKVDKEIKQGIASRFDYEELNKDIKVDDIGTFADTFVTKMNDAAEAYRQEDEPKGSKRSRLSYVTNILDAMETASAA